VRFEINAGEGWMRLFPETFSFHAKRHDPAELYLQLEDLWTKPKLLSPIATRREGEEVVRRLCANVARYLERTLDRLEADKSVDPKLLLRVYEDVALLVRLFGRFLVDKQLEGSSAALRLASHHLRKLSFRTLLALVRLRVRPESIAAYQQGTLVLIDPTYDASDTAFLAVLSEGDPERVDRTLLRLCENAFHRWLEDVCLDEENQSFERADSPFADRETEVLRAVAARDVRQIVRGRDLALFLKRPHNRDCTRVLKRLERWFLRQYDIHHASVVLHHSALLERGEGDADRVLSRHSPRNYSLALGLLLLPFAGAALAYDRAPLLFNFAASAEVVIVMLGALWYLAFRFAWKRDLTFFHASVPRIGAGIIVGYLPVFLIDEVWDLSLRSAFPLAAVSVLIGFATLLYLYVEVQRRLGNPKEAFSRASGIFLLGLLEAAVLGILATSILGRFMVARNWATVMGQPLPFTMIRDLYPRFEGALPRILGIDPVLAFPTAVFLMTFMAFFIGVFLQLLWEDLPITEPL
jgi:hypothetical protein